MCLSNWISHQCLHTTAKGTAPCQHFYQAVRNRSEAFKKECMTVHVENVPYLCADCATFAAEHNGLTPVQFDNQKYGMENVARKFIRQSLVAGYQQNQRDGGNEGATSSSKTSAHTPGTASLNIIGTPTKRIGTTLSNEATTFSPSAVSTTSPNHALNGLSEEELLSLWKNTATPPPPDPSDPFIDWTPYLMRDKEWALTRDEAALFGFNQAQVFAAPPQPPPRRSKHAGMLEKQRRKTASARREQAASAKLQPPPQPDISPLLLKAPYHSRSQLSVILPSTPTGQWRHQPAQATPSGSLAQSDDPMVALAAHRQRVNDYLLGGRPIRTRWDDLGPPLFGGRG